MAKSLLALNAGSSSIKFSLFHVRDAKPLQLASRGQIESIGVAPRLRVQDASGAVIAEQRWPESTQDFASLMEKSIGWVETQLGDAGLIAVGHRVVHGGTDHVKPERVTPELLAQLERLVPLAPLHEPHNLAPIRAIAASRPGLTQVVCFDTAFHHSMPAVAARFALPREYENAGIRRYGFHGISYEYIASRLRGIAPQLARGRVIAAHLGNGASLCAMQAGASIDTTMGFTALDGLVMGTRCGSLDPGVVLYLLQQRGMTAKQVEGLLYRQSGLLGVSGIASDMRSLLASDDAAAKDAIDLFVFRVAREVGAMVSSLGGLDGIVFTAGIGEHAAEIRARVCARLGWLGVELNADANAADAMRISTPDSRLDVLVIATDEQRMIAQHTLDAIAAMDGRSAPN